MPKKTKTQADRQLIKSLFSIDPINWARYPDGKLVFISPVGQKFLYTEQQLIDFKEDVAKLKTAGKKAAAKSKPKPSAKSAGAAAK